MSSRLEEIRARAERATPGPWGFEDADNESFVTAGRDEDGSFVYIAGEFTDGETAIFIAHAREDVPYLLGEVERLREALEEIAKIRTTQGSGLQAVDIANRALASTQEGA